MRLCLVTDRRRLTDTHAALAGAVPCLVAQARHAVAAGIDLIQLRERDLEAADLAAVAAALLAVTRGTRTRLVVNDRLDVALACGADGVHLRADSIPVAAARRMAPEGFLIGRSVHAVSDAADAAGADYVIAGTVFPSASKRSAQALLGVDGLRAIARSIDAPVLAIGGVTAAECEAVAGAGAAGVAAIGVFIAKVVEPAGVELPCRAMPLVDVVERMRAAFDRVRRRS